MHSSCFSNYDLCYKLMKIHSFSRAVCNLPDEVMRLRSAFLIQHQVSDYGVVSLFNIKALSSRLALS